MQADKPNPYATVECRHTSRWLWVLPVIFVLSLLGLMHQPMGQSTFGLPESQLYNRPQPPAPSTQSEQWFIQGRNLLHQGRWAEAIPLLQQSADAGYWKAQNNLALAYFEGHSVTPDANIACQLTMKSVAQYPDFHNINNLLLCVEEAGHLDKTAAYAVQQTARSGDAGAQWAWGNIRLSAQEHDIQNPKLGLYWLLQSAM